MGMNVPPVTGLSPAQVAIRLRQAAKNAYSIVAGQGQDGTGYNESKAEKHRARLEELRPKLREEYVAADALLKQARTDSKLRKPQHTRNQIDLILKHVRNMWDYGYEIGRSGRDGITYAKAINPSGLNHEAMLREIYALAQALPTVDNIPIGQSENTIRAIVAICKAHYGLLEGTISEAPHGEAEKMLNITAQNLEALDGALHHATAETKDLHDEIGDDE